MSQSDATTPSQPADPEVIEPTDVAEPAGRTAPSGRPDGDDDSQPAVAEPAKVMRIGSMIKQLLEEVRTTDVDIGGRNRLREIYETSVRELSGALSPELQDELRSLVMPFSDHEVPSESELRIAQAQLVGWLEGLFHGIQATLFAQQMAAQQQLEQMKQSQALSAGGQRPPQSGGVYL